LSTIVIGLSATVRPPPQQLVFGIEIAPDPVGDGDPAAAPSPTRAPATSGEETGFVLGFSRMTEPPAAADVGADGGLIPPSSGPSGATARSAMTSPDPALSSAPPGIGNVDGVGIRGDDRTDTARGGSGTAGAGG